LNIYLFDVKTEKQPTFEQICDQLIIRD